MLLAGALIGGAPMTNADSDRLVAIYRRRAAWYDRSTRLLYLAGFRHWAYRERAVRSLALSPGDTVVDLGCGTGMNFDLLQQQIGPQGKIIGVDLTDAMLDAAGGQIAARGWTNVVLVKSDAALYEFPPNLGGILSTFALTLVPEFDKVIEKAAIALPPQKHLVVLDFKMPSGRLMKWAAPLLAKLLVGPFGGTLHMASRKPWESMEKYFAVIEFTELYLGGAYIATAGHSMARPR
jgi:ubiquinone/menaquinone biosynthesis C-methylase UbiE